LISKILERIRKPPLTFPLAEPILAPDGMRRPVGKGPEMAARIDPDGYCRECRTKHGPWGHFDPVWAEVEANAYGEGDGEATDDNA
jgi:hypothetical protein